MSLELVVLRFAEPEGASNALLALRSEPQIRRGWLEEAAVVRRHGSGRVSIRGTYAGYDSGGIGEADATKAGIAVGAIGGGLIGLLGGPLGILIGAIGGGSLGGLFGRTRGRDPSEWAVFEKIKTQLPKGASALMLLAETQTVDDVIASFAIAGAELTRQPLAWEEVEQVRRLILDAGAN
jgi:uncharacterized membrane protein